MFNLLGYLEIVLKSKDKVRGIDCCGVVEYYYIICFDLGVYMRSINFY